MIESKRVLELLRRFESRNVIFAEPDGSWPMVWECARGVQVRDADGRKYLDLTGAFGVAAAGHANPNVVEAGQRQMARLLHAMGDVHPHARKADLARELSRITFERWPAAMNLGWRQAKDRRGRANKATGKVIFCNSGFEAVEAALKTALLATGKRGVVAFHGAYHGLGYGALNATHREFFRGPFRSQLREFGHFVPFPNTEMEWRSRPLLGAQHAGMPTLQRSVPLKKIQRQIQKALARKPIGAILVEPVQTRGGINVPPPEFLPLLRKLCDESGALLILDEIYTGFGRTGKWFACEHSGVVPDLICLGKALAGGFPLSACVGRADLMDAAWPPSRGEAIHTSTFLGHPVGCAMALAQIAELARLNLPERAARLGTFLLQELSKVQSSRFQVQARGLGLVAGLELRLPGGGPATAETFGVIKEMLRRGFVLLPEGEHGNVISFTPPLTISQTQLAKTTKALAEVLATDLHR